MRGRQLWYSGIATGLLLIAAGACGSNNTDNGSATCQTSLDYESAGAASVNSPATGVLTFTGQFYTTESMILGYTDNAGAHHSTPITPTSDRTSLSFTGLPSGVRTYTVTISCEAGQDSRTTGNFSVK
jgi:hypothetical protein